MNKINYAQIPVPCSCINHEGEEDSEIIIYLRNEGYGVCEKCWETSSKIYQLMLKPHPEPKKVFAEGINRWFPIIVAFGLVVTMAVLSLMMML